MCEINSRRSLSHVVSTERHDSTVFRHDECVRHISTCRQENRALLQKYRTLLQKYRALLQKYRALLQKYRALLQKYRALLQKYRALLQKYRALLQKYRALLQKYRAFLQKYRALLRENVRGKLTVCIVPCRFDRTSRLYRLSPWRVCATIRRQPGYIKKSINESKKNQINWVFTHLFTGLFSSTDYICIYIYIYIYIYHDVCVQPFGATLQWKHASIDNKSFDWFVLFTQPPFGAEWPFGDQIEWSPSSWVVCHSSWVICHSLLHVECPSLKSSNLKFVSHLSQFVSHMSQPIACGVSFNQINQFDWSPFGHHLAPPCVNKTNQSKHASINNQIDWKIIVHSFNGPISATEKWNVCATMQYQPA